MDQEEDHSSGIFLRGKGDNDRNLVQNWDASASSSKTPVARVRGGTQQSAHRGEKRGFNEQDLA